MFAVLTWEAEEGRNVAPMKTFEVCMIVLASLSLLGSWVARIRLFNRHSRDPVIQELTSETFATSFEDLLAFSLLRVRSRVPANARGTVSAFLVFYFSAFVLIIVAFLPRLVMDYLVPLVR